jgi:mono/diheme cytochrome c family protein
MIKFQIQARQDIFETINLGHNTSGMIGWGEILTAEQIQQLVNFIRQMKPAEAQPEPTEGVVSFTSDVLPILQDQCALCHGTLGGWDATSYQTVMNSGDHAPVVIPGNVTDSILAQKILGTQTEGTIMPPAGKMSDAEIQIILDWIAAGALEN